MTYQGKVKGGKLELEQPLALPDGTVVQVEILPAAGKERPSPTTDEFWTEWDILAQELDREWRSPKSILEVLSEGRR